MGSNVNIVLIFQSVLQQTAAQDGSDILASLQERHGMANRAYSQQNTTNNTNQLINTSSSLKKHGVSAESSDTSRQQASEIQVARYEKDFRHVFNCLEKPYWPSKSLV